MSLTVLVPRPVRDREFRQLYPLHREPCSLWINAVLADWAARRLGGGIFIPIHPPWGFDRSPVVWAGRAGVYVHLPPTADSTENLIYTWPNLAPLRPRD